MRRDGFLASNTGNNAATRGTARRLAVTFRKGELRRVAYPKERGEVLGIYAGLGVSLALAFPFGRTDRRHR
jgi:hypothetical protein